MIVVAALVAASGTGLSDLPDEDPLPMPAAVEPLGLLEAARLSLPLDKIDLIGDMLVRRPHGQVDYTYRFAMRLTYGAQPPSAGFTVYSEDGDFLYQLVVERGTEPRTRFENASGRRVENPPLLTDRIGRSDLTWLDLTLDYLWWPRAEIIGEDRVRGRDCHVLEVFPPDDSLMKGSHMRLWLDKELALMLQAVHVGPGGKTLRRMWIRSVRKQDDRWMIRDLEVDTIGSGYRTRLHVEDFSSEP